MARANKQEKTLANKVGRPKKYSEAELFKNKVDEYFKSITITYPLFDSVEDKEKSTAEKKIYKQIPRLNNLGVQIYNTDYIEIPSVLGLCEYLNITRETLLQYEKKVEFSDTIKKARAKIEKYLEEQLYRRDQVTGIIFNLKNNYGWKDKQEIEAKNDTTLHITLENELEEWAK